MHACPQNRSECICLKHYRNLVHTNRCALWDAFYTLRGLIKRPKRSTNEVMHLKKNSHYLSRFSDLLFERAAPGFDAQTWKFPEPGEPCAKHIKGVRLPKNSTSLFFLEVERAVVQKNFQGFCDFLWIEGHPLDWIVRSIGARPPIHVEADVCWHFCSRRENRGEKIHLFFSEFSFCISPDCPFLILH